MTDDRAQDVIKEGTPEFAALVASTVAEAAELTDADTKPAAGTRHVRLTSLATIKPRRVRWLWEDKGEGRIPLGTLGLIAGREGLGKSSIALSIAAQITHGKLSGVYLGKPKGVVICATEDAYDFTIVPRLLAAGADLNRVYRVDVTVEGDDYDSPLVLPKDMYALEKLAREQDVAMIILDPLTSRLDTGLDTHKDADVRRALEPLKAMAETIGASVIGIIHVNKSGSDDPGTQVMGSVAFNATGRFTFHAMKSDSYDTDGVCLFGEYRNNLGRTDLPTLTYRMIAGVGGEDEEGEIRTGRVEWLAESTVSVGEALRVARNGGGDKDEQNELIEEIRERLNFSSYSYVDINKALHAAGFNVSASTLKRALNALGVKRQRVGYGPGSKVMLSLSSIPVTSPNLSSIPVTDDQGDSVGDHAIDQELSYETDEILSIPVAPAGSPPEMTGMDESEATETETDLTEPVASAPDKLTGELPLATPEPSRQDRLDVALETLRPLPKGSPSKQAALAIVTALKARHPDATAPWSAEDFTDDELTELEALAKQEAP